MKAKRTLRRTSRDPVLQALQRAARNALELARRTGTACYVLEDDKIVDIAKRPRPNGKKNGKA
jgi:hypothetical protein